MCRRAFLNCFMMVLLFGIGFFQTYWQPEWRNVLEMSFPEQPIMTLPIFLALIVWTTSVPTRTPPDSSMNWSTTMTSKSCSSQIFRASSPFMASKIEDFGEIAMNFLILRLSMVRFMVTSSMIRKRSGVSMGISSTSLVPLFESPRSCAAWTGHLVKGMLTTHVVPGFTSGSDMKWMEPLQISTRCFAMASPRPVPGAPPLWTNLPKRFFCMFFGMPGPVSVQWNTPYFPSQRKLREMLPVFVYLMALVITLV
mmetsp:Transcript_8550/g.17348  ORF Transcript_8550/g.17348 Transcript_8550/m.17348 type:complete len:253 (+) Transcript_8550:429-1187(+)